MPREISEEFKNKTVTISRAAYGDIVASVVSELLDVPPTGTSAEDIAMAMLVKQLILRFNAMVMARMFTDYDNTLEVEDNEA